MQNENYIKKQLRRGARYMTSHRMLDFMKDRPYLKLSYWARTGRKLNIDQPTRYNEKLQWLKLNYHIPLYTDLVDKQHMKKYVADKIGKQYTIPTLGVWNNFDEIDFDKLPAFYNQVSHYR